MTKFQLKFKLPEHRRIDRLHASEKELHVLRCPSLKVQMRMDSIYIKFSALRFWYRKKSRGNVSLSEQVSLDTRNMVQICTCCMNPRYRFSCRVSGMLGKHLSETSNVSPETESVVLSVLLNGRSRIHGILR
jgi:hypothetical protein